MADPPVAFSFTGLSERATSLHRKVVALAQQQFPQLWPADFGDPLELWNGAKINGRDKRELSPLERLGHRASFLLQHLRERPLPLVVAGAQTGFLRRLGPDAYIGATAHKEDPAILEVWEKFVQIGIVRLGLAPPLYFWVDGNHLLRRQLDEYCERLPGQRYVPIPSDLSEEDAAWCIIGHVQGELAARGRISLAA